MFKKILIANRGEIAVRIIRSCKKMGIKTVSIYSDIDKYSMHVYLSDESICLGGSILKDTYLNIEKIIKIAKITQSEAIHPGCGFLSENATFVREINKNKITFIGPSLNLIKTFGNKINALKLAKKFGLNILPISRCHLNIYKNIMVAKRIGYPLMIKSVFGGGGKGIRLVETEGDLKDNIDLVKKEASLSYNSNLIYMEKYVKNARHIELQVFGNGKKIWLFGDRECSLQKDYQKIIEETPVKNLNRKNFENLKKKCIYFFEKIKYENIGTIEFLYLKNKFYFIEVNPRLQVEHAITECLTNIDIVTKQIEFAYNKKFSIKKNYLKIKGHSIECRINIDDYKENKIKFLHIPGGNGIRFDSYVYTGYKILPNYDKLLGKIIVNEKTRKTAIQLMLAALNEIIIYNVKTNIPILIDILSNKLFKKNKLIRKLL